MAKSLPADVNLTNSTALAQGAQQTADGANKGVNQLFDPNMMSVIEKKQTYYNYAGVSSRYNVVLANAKDVGIDTSALEAAYNKMNGFMNTVLDDTDIAGDVDRETYAQVQEDFNNELAKMQNALSADTESKMSAAASLGAVAKATADESKSDASNAVTQADSAVAAAKVVSETVQELKGGSSVTLATLENGLQEKVSNDTYTAETTKLNNLIQSKVVNNPNLIPYSGYLESTVGWSLLNWGEASATLQVFKHNFYHNAADNVLTLTCLTTEGKSVASLRFKVKPNTDYTFQMLGFASSNVKGTTVYFLGRKYGDSSDYTDIHQLINSTILSPSGLDSRTVTFNTGVSQEGYIRIDNQGTTNGASASVYFTELKMEEGTTATPYVRTVTVSEINQTDSNINLKVSNGQVASQLNIDAKHVLINTGGQLTLGGDTVYFDTKNPVIIPSANMDNLLVKKQLQAADITANTFSTNNKTFTVDQNGMITATSLTLMGNKNFCYNSELLASGAGWSILNGGYYTTASAHAGTNGIGINTNTGGATWILFGASKQVAFNVSNTNGYSASVWFIDWGSTAGTTYQFTLAFFDANGNRIDGFGAANYYADGSAHDWQLFTVQNVIPPSGAVKIGIQYWIYNGTGHAAFSQPMINQGAKYQGYTPDTGNVLSTSTVDGSATKTVTISEGAVYLDSSSTEVSNLGNATFDAVHGLNLYGNAQNICFNGKVGESGKGIKFTPYGNINSMGNQLTWYIGYNEANQVANFPLSPDSSKTISFKRPMFISKILGGQTDGGLTLSDSNDSNQLILDADTSGSYVRDIMIYKRNYTSGNNPSVIVTPNGTLGTGSSATKYKLNIQHDDSSLLADRLLSIAPATWFDKQGTENLADAMTNGTDVDDFNDNALQIRGLIAEDLHTAGLDDFTITGENGELEGIAYDRLWTVLIPKIKQLQDRVTQLEMEAIVK